MVFTNIIFTPLFRLPACLCKSRGSNMTHSEIEGSPLLCCLSSLDSTRASDFTCVTVPPSFPSLLRNGGSVRGSVFTSNVLWRTQDSPREPAAQVTSQHPLQFHARPRPKWNHPHGDTQNCWVRGLNRSRQKCWRAGWVKQQNSYFIGNSPLLELVVILYGLDETWLWRLGLWIMSRPKEEW